MDACHPGMLLRDFCAASVRNCFVALFYLFSAAVEDLLEDGDSVLVNSFSWL